MAMLELQDVSLAYASRGGGAPVTLLHGFTQRGDAWTELIGSTRDDHRWITVDIRGHGATRTIPGASYAIDACALDVSALWDALDIRRCHLVGYSMGGRLALRAATIYPERLQSLTVISAHAGLEGSERAARRQSDEQLAQRMESRGIDWFAKYWDGLPLFATLRKRRPDLAERLRQMRLSNDVASLAVSLRGMGAGAMPALWGELHAVSCPALIIAGADDARYVDYARQLGAAMPSARVEIVANAGHATHLEQPSTVGALLDQFLRDVEAPSEPGRRSTC